MKKYVFREYNLEHKAFFTLEKGRLEKVLGSSAKIEHVGSTAIVGLGGKGILDILIGVPETKSVEAKKKLMKAGYEFHEKASTPERLFFSRDYPYKKRGRRIHIHFTKFNSQDWKGIIGVRDYLRKHLEAVEQYVEIKKEAVKKAFGNGEIYRKHKEKFIEDILKKALK